MNTAIANHIIEAATTVYGVSRQDFMVSTYRNCSVARQAAMAIMLDVCPNATRAAVGKMIEGRKADTVKSSAAAYRRRLSRCSLTYERDKNIRDLVFSNTGQVRTESDVLQAMGI